MKAWHVHDGDPQEYSLLVFAPTRSRAKLVGFRQGPGDTYNYLDMQATRAPRWDGIRDTEGIIETNDDLPEEAEPFYREEEF